MKAFRYTVKLGFTDYKAGIMFSESYEDAFAILRKCLLYDLPESDGKIILEEFNTMEFPSIVWNECEFSNLKRT